MNVTKKDVFCWIFSIITAVCFFIALATAGWTYHTATCHASSYVRVVSECRTTNIKFGTHDMGSCPYPMCGNFNGSMVGEHRCCFHETLPSGNGKYLEWMSTTSLQCGYFKDVDTVVTWNSTRNYRYKTKSCFGGALTDIDCPPEETTGSFSCWTRFDRYWKAKPDNVRNYTILTEIGIVAGVLSLLFCFSFLCSSGNKKVRPDGNGEVEMEDSAV